MFCKVLKLSTGETIIGSVVEETKGYVDVERPIKILFAPRGKDSFNVMLIKWDPTSDFNLPARIFKASIVSVSEPNEEFRSSYMEIYNKYEDKQELVADAEERSTVDDLQEELETLIEMFAEQSSNNVTLH